MTGKIINIEDGKVTIRIDNGQTIMIPISDVTYNGPQIGDYVSLRRNGNQWEVFKYDGNNIRANSKSTTAPSGKKVVPAIIGVLAVIIVALVVMNVTKVSKKESEPASSVQSTAESKTESMPKKAESTISSKPDSVASESAFSSSKAAASSTSSGINLPTGGNEQKEIQMVNSGYYIDGPDPSGIYYVHYAAEIKNPNDDIAASFPDLKVTAKDENGIVVGSQDQVGMYVMPNDTVVLSSLMDAGTKPPKTVELSLSAQQYVSSTGLNIPSSSDFKIENIGEVDSAFGKKVTGQITYTGTVPCTMICVTALYKKGGQIVYSDLTFINNPTANTPIAFEITPTAVNIPEHDSVEAYAQYWG